MLRLFIIPLLAAEAFVVLNCFLWKPAAKAAARADGKKQPNLFFPLIPAVCEILLFLLVKLLHMFCLAGSELLLPKSALAVFCVVIDAAVSVYLWTDNEALRRLGKKLGILCLVLFVLEIVLFNGKSFTLHYQEKIIPVTSIQEYKEAGDEEAESDGTAPDDTNAAEDEEEVFVWKEDGHIVVKNLATIRVDDVPEWTNAISLHMEQEENQRPFQTRVHIADGNFSTAPQLAGIKGISTYKGDVIFTIKPYGKLEFVTFYFKELGSDLHIYYVTAMNKVPFSFSAVRFIALLILGGLLIVVRQFRLYEVVYDRHKRSHQIAVAVIVALCTLSSLIYYAPEDNRQPPVSYPEGFNLEIANPYEQLFDALRHGHIWLDLETDEGLEELDNVYDRMARDASGYQYEWDRAYYKGKYYSYFGIAPVLLLYFPYYWIHGELPTLYVDCMFFGIPALFFLCMAILTMVKLYVKKPNLLLLLISLPVSSALCGVYYCLQYSSMYNAPVVAGLCFLFLAWWTGFQAYASEKRATRIILFIICGIACVLSVASRPTPAVGVFILTPAFVSILMNKQYTIKYRTAQALSFLVPVCIGAAAIMYYNYIRFESPTDFGADYQLTVSNISANRLRLSALPAAAYHYLLQHPVFKSVFPFFTYSYATLGNYQMYCYLEINIGALLFPVIALGVLLFPKAIQGQILQGNQANAVQTKSIIYFCYGIALLIMWMDFCKAGVSVRYQQDFVALLLISSLLLIFNTVTPEKRYIYRLTILCFVLTFGMVWLLQLHISTEGRVISLIPTIHPALQETLEDILIFWE